MSEINSQINIQMIESIKEQSGTKTSLEKLNLILQEMHKNMMKESNSNFIKTSNIEDKNKTEEENPNQNEDSNFIEEIKGNNEENDEQDKEGTTGDNVGDNNDKISGDNLIKIRNSADYRSSNDINVINKRSSDFNINNNINYINNINNKLINNIISNDEKKEEEEEKFDEEFGICPITQEYMKNPVLTPSGNYYEKSAIIDWLKTHNNDPLSREFLSVDMLVEDHDFKQKIIEYRRKFNK